nr:DNA-directed RNA polymerase II subunit RPB7 [Ipomoea batatas]
MLWDLLPMGLLAEEGPVDFFVLSFISDDMDRFQSGDAAKTTQQSAWIGLNSKGSEVRLRSLETRVDATEIP